MNNKKYQLAGTLIKIFFISFYSLFRLLFENHHYSLFNIINQYPLLIFYNISFLIVPEFINNNQFTSPSKQENLPKSLMMIGHGLIAITGALFIYDWIRFRKEKEEQKHKPKTLKLCLTGGPCGGKSEGIEAIYTTFKKVAAPFFIVPEAATLIGSSGLTLDFSNFTEEQIQNFQIYLMRLQYNLQGILSDVAQTLQKLRKCPVLLCDRGLLDGKAYAGDQNWARMLKHLNITEEQINNRYKAVIHMQTAARGAQSSYFYVPPNEEEKHKDEEAKGNKTRKQPPEDAIRLDEKVQACYKNHPFRFVIRNYFFVTSFQMKKILLVAQVNQILEFVLSKVSIQNYYSDGQVEKLTNNKEAQVVAYLERKKKIQKFIKKAKNAAIP